MKAIRVKQFGGPEVCELDSNVPVPVPTAGQVLIAVHYAGFNPLDMYVRSGSFPRRPALPYTPGLNCAGVVEAVGADVKHFKAGDRVFVSISEGGTYAEYALAKSANVFPLHDSLTFAQGACMGILYYTAYRSLFHKGNARPGMTVLVHGGSGGVGVAAIQIARAHGLTVLATAGTERGLQLVLEQGAHAAFCHREQGYVQQILDYTGGKGVDVILEMAAGTNLQTDLTLLAPQGKVVVIGSGGSSSIDARMLMGRESAIVGQSLYFASEANLQEMQAAMWAGCEKGWLRPVVDREYELADAASAHRDIAQATGAAGGIVLKVA